MTAVEGGMEVFNLVAAFLYRDEENKLFERSSDILFLAQDDATAALAAWRWVRNRQRAAPEFFGTLGALKVYRYHIGVPEPDGYIRTMPDLGWYEWKCDRGEPPLIPPNQ
jgi:hypothetical protein